MFRRDKHGNFYCVDRLKELIKYSKSGASPLPRPAPPLTTGLLDGYPVAPAELEGILVGHQEVADACVIGFDDPAHATEVPRAYVVVREGVVASEDKAQELADWVATQVAPHKKLRGGVRFVNQIPKSPSGKVLRRVMKEEARKEQRALGAKL